MNFAVRTPATSRSAATFSPAAAHVRGSAITIAAVLPGNCSLKTAGTRAKTPSPIRHALVSVAFANASSMLMALLYQKQAALKRTTRAWVQKPHLSAKIEL